MERFIEMAKVGMGKTKAAGLGKTYRINSKEVRCKDANPTVCKEREGNPGENENKRLRVGSWM